jgi:small-conductance mechanosensitive channel
VFLIVVTLLLKIIRKAIYRVDKIDIAKKYSIYSLIRYLIIVIAIISGLQLFGFNLSVLVAGSAALLVGVGLGLQNLFSDFVSGIILLVDSSVKVNDVIELNGLVCTVQEINLRTTTVLTRDDKYIILPNSDLTRNQLINWTHSDLASRFEVTVGVDYSSDIHQVIQILKKAVDSQNNVLKEPNPFIRFTDFGDSSLNFSVIFWSEELFRIETTKSDLRIKIFELFKENNITIPFPQRVVHINN